VLRWGRYDLDKISQTGAEWDVDCGDMVEIKTRSRIPMANVLVNSMARHRIATCHIAGWKNSIRHIENRSWRILCFFCFLCTGSLDFGERRLSYRLWYTCCNFDSDNSIALREVTPHRGWKDFLLESTHLHCTFRLSSPVRYTKISSYFGWICYLDLTCDPVKSIDMCQIAKFQI